MINIYDLARFYSSTIEVLLNRIYRLSSQIITSESIDEKIRCGLNLSELWIVADHLIRRLDAMASPPIIDCLEPNKPYEVNDLASVLHCCDRILNDEEHVLLAHEQETVRLIQDRLSDLAPLLGSDKCAKFPPARSNEMKYSNERPFSANGNEELVANNKSYIAFLYYVLVDVEVSAMEICSHQILNNKGMPREFALDLTKQIWDEARHAQYMYELFIEKGGDQNTQVYTNNVIERYMQSESLLESLIIQQILQEGNAVEINLSLIKELTLLNRNSEANAFYNINNDEAYHVTIGNKWIRYLVEADGIQEEELLQLMLNAADKIDIPLFGKGGWNAEIRKLVGFPSWFIEVREQIFAH
ncbi:DUF455 family protein [Vibrio coralliilyticus]|uniref:DUF455 family protein n=1 Tax=Vibrio coralliilyticus TaxID=190893 RepID=UPI0015CE691E|nr:DUF455 family protein [Vibrio coralliilyticus]MCC2520603.1 ferritin-like domain-containing protein [Vibrio coralliilyticus]